jgi:Rad3-related DNA helicase
MPGPRREETGMSLADRVEALLAPGGRLSSHWPRYEDRLAQRHMARDVAATFEQGGVLLAEAPTGVGKSLAYLLPAVLLALESERRVVIATCTKSLQDQLFERDLPALLEALGVTLPCARLKGKQNYLCPRELEVADADAAEERECLEELRRWASEEETGDLDRFPAADPEAFRRVRGRVATDPVACSGITCRRGRECFWVKARRRAGEARLLIVNHALLALAGESEGLLPDFDLLVVDEAHRLEGVLLAQLSRSVSRNRIEEGLRTLGTKRGARAGGLLARASGLLLPLFEERSRGDVRDQVESLAARIPHARDAAERFFAAIEPAPRDAGGTGERAAMYGARARFRSAEELMGRDLQPLEALLGECAAFASGLMRLAAAAGTRVPPGGSGARSIEEELEAEMEQGAAQWTALRDDLAQLAQAADRDWVYWRTSGGRGVELFGAPVSVGEHARRLVLGRARGTVLTSATLAADGDFGFTAERLGMGETHGVPYRAVAYPSPFPLARQMRAFVTTDPGTRDEAEGIATVVAALAETGRNLLVLFTAHERLRRVRERLRGRLAPDRVLLAQEWDGPASRVSERFRAHRGAVLLGVQSLWEGVDFPGEALEILVVAKLPFSVPDDPLVEARGERMRERGLDPFRADAIPEAVLRFRQGVGRLIRRADDRGVLVVCDPRLLRASYRRPFLEALPVPALPAGDGATLVREAAAFLAASASAPDEPPAEPDRDEASGIVEASP